MVLNAGYSLKKRTKTRACKAKNRGYLLALCPLSLLEWYADKGVLCKILIPYLT